jgi:NitT/TauT family transport system permease protein
MSVAIFGSILNLYTAFINVDQEKIKLIYTLHGNRRHALTKVVLPSSVPAIISNMKVNIGLCLVGVIIGEFLAAKSGLGYLIIYSSQVFKMDWLLMSIILLCIMAMGLYALINVVEKRVLKKY